MVRNKKNIINISNNDDSFTDDLDHIINDIYMAFDNNKYNSGINNYNNNDNNDRSNDENNDTNVITLPYGIVILRKAIRIIERNVTNVILNRVAILAAKTFHNGYIKKCCFYYLLNRARLTSYYVKALEKRCLLRRGLSLLSLLSLSLLLLSLLLLSLLLLS